MTLPLADRELISYKLIKKCSYKELDEFILNDSNCEKIRSLNSIFSKYKFNSYKDCIDFVIHIGNLAERYNHHPKIILCANYVEVIWHTWTIQDVSDNDLIMAAKTSRTYNEYLTKGKEII